MNWKNKKVAVGTVVAALGLVLSYGGLVPGCATVESVEKNRERIIKLEGKEKGTRELVQWNKDSLTRIEAHLFK